MGYVWHSIDNLAVHIEDWRTVYYGFGEIVLTSIPADPVHEGHVRLINESARLADRLVVVVNDDDFLIKKKGFYAISEKARAEIISAFAGVDDVVIWHSENGDVADAILKLKPTLFTKGGADRAGPQHIVPAELKACEEVGCRLVYGVGGAEKVNSSSEIAKRIYDALSH